jgi:hypothetical protein
MQRRQTVPSSRQQNANQSPLPPVDSSRPSLLSQLLSLLTRVLLTVLAYPLSYLPKPKGLNADTSTSDALATKESLNIPSNLGVSYPQALKHCCPDLVEGEMPEFRLLVLVIHSPLHPLSRSLISSLESATPESVSSNEMNLLIGEHVIFVCVCVCVVFTKSNSNPSQSPRSSRSSLHVDSRRPSPLPKILFKLLPLDRRNFSSRLNILLLQSHPYLVLNPLHPHSIQSRYIIRSFKISSNRERY